jgi:hypothetical protein
MATKINLKNKLSDVATRLFNVLVLPLTRYVTESEIYQMVSTESGYTMRTNPTSNLSIVNIINRACYSEFSKTYPLASAKDLKAVLNSEYHGKLAFHMLYPEQNQHTLVFSFVVHDSVRDRLPPVCVVLPESLLLHKGLSGKHCLLSVFGQQGEWFLYSKVDRFSSQMKSTLCPTADVFALAYGVPDSAENVRLERTELASALLCGISKVGSSLFSLFLVVSASTFAFIPWRKVGISAAIILNTYFLTASTYINHVISTRSGQLEELRPAMNEILVTQQNYEKLVESTKVVAKELGSQQVSDPAWEVILLLIEQGVDLSAIEWKSKTLMLKGSVGQATDLLSSLKVMPTIASASFTEPTRRDKDKDSFQIELIFRTGVDNVTE